MRNKQRRSYSYGKASFRTLLCLRLVMSILPFVLIAGGCGRGRSVPSDKEVPIEQSTFSFDQGQYPSEQDLFPKYDISAGDVLDVLFQIERQHVENFPITLYHTVAVKFADLPKLNETQKVLPDGTIMLPYLGAVDVLGKTPSEVREELNNRYSAVLQEPQVYVTIPDFDARIEQLRDDLHTSPRGLSKLVTVRPDGRVTFPLVGEFLVAEKTVKEVNNIIQEAYKEYLPGLKVDLFLHEQGGSVVYVVGEVNEAGTYEITKPISVIQALSLAGGYTQSAELKNVIVFRKREEKHFAKRLNLKSLSKGVRGSRFFYLKPDDIVFVPETRISELAQLMSQISDIAMFRGWSFTYSLDDKVDFVGGTD